VLFAAADTRHLDLTANDALACLFDLGDPPAPALLARDLRHRAQALATVGIVESSRPWMAVRFDPGLLDAIRSVLGNRDDAGALLPGRPGHTRRNAVAGLVGAGGRPGDAGDHRRPARRDGARPAPLAAVGGPLPEAVAARYFHPTGTLRRSGSTGSFLLPGTTTVHGGDVPS
jgi:hypothetical protein